MNPYDILGVDKHATPSEIRSRLRRKVLQCHPYKVQGDDLKRQRADGFFRVQQAYEVLNTETRRQDSEIIRLKRGNVTNTTGNGVPDEDASHRISDVSESRLAIPGQNRSETALKVVHDRDDGNVQLQEISRDAMATVRVNGESKWSYTFCGLEGRINGTLVFALADTGSHRNFINSAYAKSLGLESTHYALNQRPSFVTEHGRTIQAIGEIEITWQFEGDSNSSYQIVLQVLPNSIFDIMIGGEFLYETNTMAGNGHRLCRIPKPDRAMLATKLQFLRFTPSLP
ncbi:MAG: hypothetical protein Q9217_000894 [Psora testacea]